jgi:hypothetical protein
MGVFQFFGCGVGKALEEEGTDAVGPSGIDDGFVSQNGVSVRWRRAGYQDREGQREGEKLFQRRWSRYAHRFQILKD